MHKKMDQHKVLSHLQSRLLTACQVEAPSSLLASKVGVEIQKFLDPTVNVSSRQHKKEANRAHKQLVCFKRRLPRRVASIVSRAWSSKRVVGVDPPASCDGSEGPLLGRNLTHHVPDAKVPMLRVPS